MDIFPYFHEVLFSYPAHAIGAVAHHEDTIFWADVAFINVKLERDDLGYEFQESDVGSATEVEREFVSPGSTTVREAAQASFARICPVSLVGGSEAEEIHADTVVGEIQKLEPEDQILDGFRGQCDALAPLIVCAEAGSDSAQEVSCHWDDAGGMVEAAHNGI